jgi:SAM-dependent methyltransferase
MTTEDHVQRNREAWAEYAKEFVEPGHQAWASEEPRWGIWHVPEAELHVLPDDLEGKDVVELGCGSGYVSAWVARRGANPIGIDLTWNQLASAVKYREEFGIPYPLVQGNGEQLPFRDATFDMAISEYGVCLWCDPYRWIPEAARVLRPGGELVFYTSSVQLMLCVPDTEAEGPTTDRLLRDQFGMHRVEWPDEPAVEFHLSHSDMIKVLRDNGFEILELIEVRPPEGSTTRYPYTTIEWSRRWPCEEVWKARKVS